MQQFLHKLLLMAAILVAPWVTQGQSISTFPYTESFESETNGWTQSGSLWTRSNDDCHGAGSYCMAVPGDGAAMGDTLYSPVFDFTGVTTPTLNFWYKQPDWGGDQNELYVYYRTSATGSWTLLASYTSSVTDWTEVSLLLTPGSSGYFQLAFYGYDGYGHDLVLDDIMIFNNTCPRPQHIVSSISGNIATLSWSGTASSYVLEFADSAFVPGTGHATRQTVSDTTVTLTGLSYNTTYHYYLRSDCGSDTSVFVGGTFLTQPDPDAAVSLPYHTDFGTSAEWVYLSGTQTNYWAVIDSAMTITTNGTTRGYNASASSNSYAFLPINFEDTGMYICTYSWNGTGESTWDFARMFLVPGSITPVPGQDPAGGSGSSSFGTSVPAGWICLDNATRLNAQPGGTRTTAEMRVTTAGTYKLVLFWTNDGSGGSNPTAFTSLSVYQPLCPDVRNVTVMPGITNAMVSWTNGAVSGTPESYTITLTDSAGVATTHTSTSASPSFLLSGLAANTPYTVKVQADCGSDGEGNADSASFTTRNFTCSEYASRDTATIGTMYSTTTFPLAGSYYNLRYQEMFSPSEMSWDPGAQITGMQLHVSSSTNGYFSWDRVRIYLDTVSLTSLTGSYTDMSSAVLVYDGSFSLPAGSAGQWMEIPFDNAYGAYDTSKALLMTVISGVSSSQYPYFYYTSGAGRAYYSYNYTAGAEIAPDGTGATGNYTTSSKVDVRFVGGICQTYSTCAAPLAAVSGVSDTSATINWEAGADETSWNVYYRIAGTSGWTLAAEETDLSTCTVSPLMPGATYEVMVMGICEDSLSTTVSFTTQCGPLYRSSLPYAPQFPTMSGDMPNCWTKARPSDYYPRLSNGNVSGVSRYLYFSQHSTSYPKPIAVMPESMVSVDSLELTFNVYKGYANYSGRWIVGVMDNPAVDTTFVPVDTVEVGPVGRWTTMNVDLHGYTGTGRYVALYYPGTADGVYNYGYVSNVVLELRNPCRRPSGYMSDITYHSAVLNIQDQENAPGDVNGYQAFWGTVNDISRATDSATFGGSSLQLDNLNYSTTYYVWVRTTCSDNNSRYATQTFTTRPPCVEVENLRAQVNAVQHYAVLSWMPSTEGFANTAFIVRYKAASDTAWTIDTVTTNYYQITGLTDTTGYLYKVTTVCDAVTSTDLSGTFTTASCNSIGAETGISTYVPFYRFYNYGYSQVIYSAAELNQVDDTINGIYLFSAYNRTDTAHCLLDVYVGNTDQLTFATTADYVPLDSLTMVDSSLNWGYTYGWNYLPFSAPYVRSHGSNLVLAFANINGAYSSSQNFNARATNTPGQARSLYFYQDGSIVNPASPSAINSGLGAYVPNIIFDASCLPPSCNYPVVISTAATTGSVDMRWFAGLDETTWDVDYRLLGDTVWTSFLTATTLTSCTVTGLQAGAEYEVRVTPGCSTGGSYSAVCEVATLCGQNALPFTEDFTTAGSGEFARPCWIAGAEDETYPLVADLATYGKMLSVNNGAYVALPEFTQTVNHLQMHLTYWGTNPGVFGYVGVLTNPGSIASFVPVDTLTVTTAAMLENATVRFGNYNDSIGRICIYVPAGYPVGGHQFFVDNIIVEPLTSCPDVDSIYTTATGSTSASLAWTMEGPGTASGYLVEYGASGFVPGAGTVIATTAASASLTGLTASTSYDVYVTPICSTGDTTYTSAAFRFHTDCEAMPIPYEMNFDLPYLSALTQTQQLPVCWYWDEVQFGTGSYYYAPQITYNSNAVSGRNTLYLYGLAVTALPAMSQPLDTLMLTFHEYRSGSYYGLIVGVVDSVTPGFAASFVPVDTIDVMNGNDTVFFCNYTGSGQHIAFKNYYNSTYSSYYSYHYIDDVKVDYRPACMPVTSIVRDSSSQTSITFHWDGTCLQATSYLVEWGPTGFTQGTGVLSTTTGTGMTQTGLSEATAYDVYVAPVCLNGDTGAWFFGTLTTRACNNPDTLYAYDTAAATTTTDYFPGNSYYNYGFTEVILDSADMAAAGFAAGNAVAGMAFLPTTTTAASYYDNCDIYMKNVALDHFTSSSDLVPMQPSDKVYSGNLNHATVDWVYREFDSPFVWDGSSNVVIAVDRNHGSYLRGHTVAAITDTVARMLYNISDDYNHDPGSTTINSASTSRNRPILKLLGCMGPSCSAPVVTTITHDYQSAVINWNGTAESYELMVKAATASEWPAATTVNALTYALNGLQPATGYLYRLRSVCDVNLVSDWVEGTFTTDSLPCFAPSGLTATEGFGSAELNWTAGSNETQWRVHVWNTTFDSVYIANAKPYTATGLTSGTQYHAAVAAVCGGGLLVSDYSDTISIRTNTCDVPTGLATSNVTANSVHVTWNAGANNTGKWIVEYGVEGYVSGQGTEIRVTSTSADLTGLEPDLTYDVYVRAVCDDVYPSGWSNKATFTTQGVGIDNVGAVRVTLFPNPAANSTTVSVNGVEGMVTITVVDMNGRAVRTETVECSSDCTKTMDIDNLAAGAYFVRIQGGGINVVKKLVVKQ